MGLRDIEVITKVKIELITTFKIVNIGPINFYLGLKVNRNHQKRTIKLSQPIYIQKILTKYYPDKVNTTNTPMKKVVLRPNLFTKTTQAEIKSYQEMTDLLMFLIVETRPDIAFFVTVGACFIKNPSHSHTEVVKTIL